MLKVELIYDADCPNAKDARAHLLRAFAETGLRPEWQEWDRRAPESPIHVRHYGSPTILINGQDVAGALPDADADCCRLYASSSGQRIGVPPTEAIAQALARTKESVLPNQAISQRGGWRSALATLPALGTALLPKVACPACWPAYAGLLSALGLGFVNYAPYLLPLTTVFLILSVSLLGYRAQTRRGYRPFLLGMLAAIMVMVGKFVLSSDVALYGGVALLVAASLWNAWPKRRERSGSCPVCLPAGVLPNHQGMHNIKITSERR